MVLFAITVTGKSDLHLPVMVIGLERSKLSSHRLFTGLLGFKNPFKRNLKRLSQYTSSAVIYAVVILAGKLPEPFKEIEIFI